jgi:hypothetical protein
LNTYKAPGLLEGGIEFTVAVATLDVEPVLHAARNDSKLSALAPTSTAEPFKKLLRLTEDPKFDSVPIKNLPEKRAGSVEQIFGVTFTLFWARGKHRKSHLSRVSSVFDFNFVRQNQGIVYLN